MIDKTLQTYESKKECPKREDFYHKRTREYSQFKIDVFDKTAYDIAMKEYLDETKRLEEKLKADLLKELGITNHPKADKLWKLANKYGRRVGEVHTTAFELYELLD